MDFGLFNGILCILLAVALLLAFIAITHWIPEYGTREYCRGIASGERGEQQKAIEANVGRWVIMDPYTGAARFEYGPSIKEGNKDGR